MNQSQPILKNRQTLTPPKPTALIVIFWVILGIDIGSAITHFLPFHIAIRPLLLPLLVLFLVFYPAFIYGKRVILLGLFFSWVSDTLLAFESFHPLFFTLGIIALLGGYFTYSYYFLSIKPKTASLLKTEPWWGFCVFGYLIFILTALFPVLGEYKLQVFGYAIVACGMLMCSIHIFSKTNRDATSLYILSSALFVASNSILVIQKFYGGIPFADAFIMLAYGAAQFFMMKGAIKDQRGKKPANWRWI